MARPAGRRKVRKRKTKTEKTGVKLGAVAVIMLLAVLLGFVTARFVIGPIIGYNTDESEIHLAEDRDGKEPDSKETDSKVSSEGYALQFGAFSTIESAQKLCDMLKEKGIVTEIVQADEVFKVISPVIYEKEKALSTLEEMKEKEVTDVFITTLG